MIQRKNDEVYHAFIESKLDYSEAMVLKTLIIFSSVYENMSVYDTYSNESDSNLNLAWKELILANTGLVDFENQLGIRLNVDFSSTLKGELTTENVENAIEVYYGEKESKYYIGLYYYVNAFTDKIYVKYNGEYIEYDNSLAAEPNRQKLTILLKRLSEVLDGNVTQFSSCYIDSSGLFERGILDNAILEYY